MKVCFFVDNIFTLGGVQRVVSVLSNELMSKYKIEIVCIEDDIKIDRNMYNLNKNIDVHLNIVKKQDKLINKIKRKINNKLEIYNNEKNIKKLEEIYFPKQEQKKWIDFFDKNKYDVIIGVADDAIILLGLLSEQINSKLVGWQHGQYESYLYGPSRKMRNTLLLDSIKKLDEYIVLNEFDQEKYLKNNSIKCKYMYNPKSFNSEEKSTLDEKTFLAAGRFVKSKGFDLLIESFKLFSEKEKEWKLIIVGDGYEKDNIIKLINKHKLDNRVFVKEPTNDIKKYFLDSSALLFPSRFEAQGLLVIEALEMGVPIISYDVTGLKPVFETYKEGIKVKNNDIVKFSDAMIEISQNEELRKKMGKNAVERAKYFDIEQVGKRWIDILSNL